MRNNGLKQVLLTLLIICCISIPYAKAVELRIPAKPDSFICDHAKIMRATELGLAHYSAYQLYTYHHLPAYFVTVPGDYVPYIDTFVNLLCSKWRICGDDSSVLLIMTSSKHHELYMVVGNKMHETLNDTMTAFLTEEYLPRQMQIHNDGSGDASSYAQDAYHTVLTYRMNSLELWPTEYENFRDHYKNTANGQSHSLDIGEIDGGLIVAFIFMSLYIALALFLTIYKTDRSAIITSKFIYFIFLLGFIPIAFFYSLFTRKVITDPLARKTPPAPQHSSSYAQSLHNHNHTANNHTSKKQDHHHTHGVSVPPPLPGDDGGDDGDDDDGSDDDDSDTGSDDSSSSTDYSSGSSDYSSDSSSSDYSSSDSSSDYSSDSSDDS